LQGGVGASKVTEILKLLSTQIHDWQLARHHRLGDRTAAEGIMKVDPLIVSGVRTFRVHTWLIANADNAYLP
jgi:hypothetical protein